MGFGLFVPFSESIHPCVVDCLTLCPRVARLMYSVDNIWNKELIKDVFPFTHRDSLTNNGVMIWYILTPWRERYICDRTNDRKAFLMGKTLHPLLQYYTDLGVRYIKNLPRS